MKSALPKTSVDESSDHEEDFIFTKANNIRRKK
jgi:hypothetical protein